MLSNKKTIITIIALLFVVTLQGQNGPVAKDTASVQLMARAQQDKILLRWAVDQPLEWQKANTYGFYVNKYVFSRNGVRVEPLKKVNPTPIFIKAAHLQEWRELVKKNNYAAIVAQALYGESFVVGGTQKQGKLAKIVNMAKELQQRFSFGLYAADMSFEAAQKAGWGYVDYDVQPGVTYVYQIKTAIPKTVATVKSAAVTIGLDDYEVLPQPIGLHGIWGDKTAMLSWESALLKSIYTAYQIERSVDGLHYAHLSATPIVNLNNKPNAPARSTFYLDTLAQNNKTYYYRIYGITPFGEKGPYSEVISGQGVPSLTYTPRVSSYQWTDTPNEALIEWEFPVEGEKRIRKFTMIRADQVDGPYEVIFDSIPKSKRQIRFSDLHPSNYVKIQAIGQNDQMTESYATLIQPVDSIPPVPPTGLMGIIDTLGVVELNWTPNTEKDILGYRVFRKNIKDEELVQLTVSPIKKAHYKDTVQLKSLNAKVYYSIVAVDRRYNKSEFSEILQLEKPDIVPPSSPVFSDYEVKNGEVLLQWIPSSEENSTHQLYRKNLTDDLPWEIVFSTQEDVTSYTDKAVTGNKTYRYAIMAVDENGLESVPSTPITVTVTQIAPQAYIKSAYGLADRTNHIITLHWRLENEEEVAEVTIYKNTPGEPPATFRVLPASITTLTDKNIHPNNTYTYHLRATLKTGAYTQVETVEVKY